MDRRIVHTVRLDVTTKVLIALVAVGLIANALAPMDTIKSAFAAAMFQNQYEVELKLSNGGIGGMVQPLTIELAE